MILKRRFLKPFFAILSVIVVLVSFSLNVFASERPSFWSSGFSYNGDYIYSGNNDVSIILGLYVEETDPIDLSTSLNPSFSFDMVSEGVGNVSYDYVSPVPWGPVQISVDYSNFECSDNYFVSGIASNNSYFGSDFDLTYYDVDGLSYSVNYIKVSAQDFYIYLNPNGEYVDPYYEDYYAESFIHLNGNSKYNGAEGSIYYCLAGEEDTANNRQVYNFSIGSDVTTSNSSFSTLPVDQSFSGLYSEPTLIYVEYFELFIPFGQQNYYGLDGFEVSGVYANYNMDYRNIDITSYEEPISPINPGIFRDYTGWLGTAVSGFLDLQIVDGFTLGGILMTLIGFLVAVWFLKVFAGG